MKHFVFTFLVIFFFACEEKKEEVLPVVPLGDGISLNANDSDSIKMFVHSIIPLELTDSSLLGEIRLIDDTLGRLVVEDGNIIHTFDNQTGKFMSTINRQGEGPEEYVYISDIQISPKDSCVYILDGAKHAINIYSMENEFINSFRNDSIVSLAFMNNGNWATFNSQIDTCNYDICIYSSKWEPVCWKRERKEQLYFNGLIPEYTFNKIDDEIFTYLSDTLFCLQNNGELSAIFWINKGKLKMPSEVVYDMARQAESEHYIWEEGMYYSDTFCFLSYMYNRKRYYDIWNIHSGKLCYRNVMAGPEDPIGLSVNIGDITVQAWPSFTKNNLFYCILDEVEAGKLNPTNSDSNPCILRLKLK